VQAKGIHNIFNKIITENFPNLEKEWLIQPVCCPRVCLVSSRTPNQNITFPLAYYH
jgi:hypothetical protein